MRRLSFSLSLLIFAVFAVVTGDLVRPFDSLPVVPGDSPVPNISPVDQRFVTLSSVDGSGYSLLKVILLWSACCAAFGLLRYLVSWNPWTRLCKQPHWVAIRLALGLLLGLMFYSAAYSEGRPILAVSLALPGTLSSRSFNLFQSASLARAFDWSLILLVALSYLSAKLAESSGNIKSPKLFNSAALLALVTLLLESVYLQIGGVFALSEITSRVLTAVHFVLNATIPLLITQALIWDRPSVDEVIRRRFRITSRIPAFVILSWLAVIVLLPLLPQASGSIAPRIGAHYYSWFPENWSHGYAASKLTPPAGPALGEYTLREGGVFPQHLVWAEEAGIDFLILDWWPTRERLKRRIQIYLEEARKSSTPVKIALQYETIDLKRGSAMSLEAEQPNEVFLTRERVEDLIGDWVFLVQEVVQKNPNYLRINGRPVLFVYASRHLLGSIAPAFRFVRAHVKARTGEELFLVGDEVFFNALTKSGGEPTTLLPEGTPDWNRLSAFDAITAYNPYETTRQQYAGAEGAEQFLGDVERLYQRYARIAASANQLFFPGVIPSYNDRGVRHAANHYVVPDRFGVPERSFLKEALERWARPHLDDPRALLAVTSWNEWNEGTALEPSLVSELTSEDTSPSMRSFTTGEFAGGYGCQRLEELQGFAHTLGNHRLSSQR